MSYEDYEADKNFYYLIKTNDEQDETKLVAERLGQLYSKFRLMPLSLLVC